MISIDEKLIWVLTDEQCKFICKELLGIVFENKKDAKEYLKQADTINIKQANLEVSNYTNKVSIILGVDLRLRREYLGSIEYKIWSENLDARPHIEIISQIKDFPYTEEQTEIPDLSWVLTKNKYENSNSTNKNPQVKTKNKSKELTIFDKIRNTIIGIFYKDNKEDLDSIAKNNFLSMKTRYSCPNCHELLSIETLYNCEVSYSEEYKKSYLKEEYKAKFTCHNCNRVETIKIHSDDYIKIKEYKRGLKYEEKS